MPKQEARVIGREQAYPNEELKKAMGDKTFDEAVKAIKPPPPPESAAGSAAGSSGGKVSYPAPWMGSARPDIAHGDSAAMSVKTKKSAKASSAEYTEARKAAPPLPTPAYAAHVSAGAYPVSSAVTIPYRRFLLPGKGRNILLDPELKSFVVFTHRPVDEAETKEYHSVSSQWVADFEDYESASETAKLLPVVKLTPFYWPTTLTNVVGSTCKDLFAYDYSFASAVVALVGPQGESQGPLLVLQQQGQWLVLDISKFDPVDVQRAFTIWKRQIVSKDPVSAKFTFVKFREYFRTLVNTYGDQIVKYAEKVAG
jgi:hypothetical protein